jgi:hypothetical protein
MRNERALAPSPTNRRVPHIPDFLWSFVGSLNFMRLSLKERRTRGPVQSCVQEIRGISLVFREMWDTTGLPLKPSRVPQLHTGAPCSHQRRPDFPLSHTSHHRGCGFLSKKAAGSLTTPPRLTGNPGYVGRIRWAKPSTALCSGLDPLLVKNVFVASKGQAV